MGPARKLGSGAKGTQCHHFKYHHLHALHATHAGCQSLDEYNDSAETRDSFEFLGEVTSSSLGLPPA